VGPEDGAGIPQDFAELLDAAVDTEEPVEVAVANGITTYRLAGRPFAIAQGLTFDAHVGPEVGRAALRTPDVAGSPHGDGWVRLEPAAIDDHAADRAVAWYELARRIAAGKRPPGEPRVTPS
jgi:hypothetical protein